MIAPVLLPRAGAAVGASPAHSLAPEAALDAAARRCAVCGGKPASFGFGVGPDRPGTWFCHAHRGLGDRRAS